MPGVQKRQNQVRDDKGGVTERLGGDGGVVSSEQDAKNDDDDSILCLHAMLAAVYVSSHMLQSHVWSPDESRDMSGLSTTPCTPL